MSNILVTGGSGVIGKEIIKFLIESGEKVYNIDLIETIENKDHSEDSYCFIKEDLNNITEENILEINPEKIFHLSATFERTSESFEHFDNNYYSNIASTHNLLQKITKLENLKKFIFASSYLIYDPALYLFPKPSKTPFYLKEDDKISPRNLTGSSKYFNEKEIRFFFENKLNAHFISARIFRGYGLGSKDFISNSIKKVLNKETINIYNPEGCFDYLYSIDAAIGLIKLSDAKYSGEINLGSGKSRSINSVLEKIEKVCGKFNYNITIEADTKYENSASDNTLLKSKIGWTPSYNFQKSIEEIVTYHS